MKCKVKIVRQDVIDKLDLWDDFSALIGCTPLQYFQFNQLMLAAPKQPDSFGEIIPERAYREKYLKERC